jgi:hypothetical protein
MDAKVRAAEIFMVIAYFVLCDGSVKYSNLWESCVLC